MAEVARVLVVDDDAVMLASVSRMLSRQGYEVLPASPRQALEIVRTPPPVQLILSDLEMPEIRGTPRRHRCGSARLVSELLQLSPQTAGLLVTGSVASTPDVPEGVAVVRKPFSTEALILAVQSTLRRSAELLAESRELCGLNKQLISELNETVQKSIALRVSSGKRRS